MGKKRIVMMAAAGLVVLAGCGGEDAGGDGSAAAATGAVEVEAGDLSFEPEQLAARAGDIEVSVVNVDSQAHNFVVEEAGDTEVVHAEPGETTTGTISLETGTYTFYCSIPGHREAGMEGTLEVN